MPALDIDLLRTAGHAPRFRLRSPAGLLKRAGAPSRATGITAYLENGGTLEHAQQIANHDLPAHHQALRPALG